MSSIYKSAAGEAALLRWYDEQLNALPFVPESLYVETPAGRTHVLAAGPAGAAPVVLLHGMNMNAAAMGGALRHLAGHRRVFAIDIVGMPGKSAGTRLPRGGDGYPRWLYAVLDGLSVESTAFVGVSFGGWLVLKLAAVAPERIRAAVLLDTGGFVPFSVGGQMVAGWAALRYMWRPSQQNGLRAARPFFGPGIEPDQEFVELLTLGYRHTRLDIDLKGLPVLSAAELSGFSAPTFVSYGEHDIFFDAGRAVARAREVLTGFVVSEIIAGEGHVKSDEAERRLYERVRGFLSDQGL